MTSGRRAYQKRRTRNALLNAAARLVQEGRDFSVADVADLAQVGRTTAYRYFADIESLIAYAELSVIADVEQRAVSAHVDHAGTPQERLEALINSTDASISKHENLFRAVLSVSLDPRSSESETWPQRRGIRRSQVDGALGSVRKTLGPVRYRRLLAALNMFLGIEGMIVMRDVCHVSPEEMREAKLWGASALLAMALAEAAEEEARTSQSVSSAPSPRRKRQEKAAEL